MYPNSETVIGATLAMYFENIDTLCKKDKHFEFNFFPNSPHNVSNERKYMVLHAFKLIKKITNLDTIFHIKFCI